MEHAHDYLREVTFFFIKLASNRQGGEESNYLKLKCVRPEHNSNGRRNKEEGRKKETEAWRQMIDFKIDFTKGLLLSGLLNS